LAHPVFFASLSGLIKKNVQTANHYKLKVKRMFSSLPKPLQNILQGIIEARKNKKGSPVDKHFFSSLNLDDFKHYSTSNHPPDESYGRQTIYQDSKLRVLFMTWCPGDFTAIHNHGPAEWGYVYAFGDITHRIYKEKGQQLKLDNSETFKARQLAVVSPGLIHMMGNQGEQLVQSLHIYGVDHDFGFVENAKVFQPETSQVVEAYGPAFLNLQEHFIVSKKRYERYDICTIMDYYALVQCFFNRINKKEMLQSMLDNHELNCQE
jgi:cysteine dioxygenase